MEQNEVNEKFKQNKIKSNQIKSMQAREVPVPSHYGYAPRLG